MLGHRHAGEERSGLARIAVVGSGIGGLAAAWALSTRRHRVTLYEAQPTLGMDAYSVDVPGPDGEVRVDVPMRVFFPEYYPTLVRLYDEAAVAYETLDYSASFGSVSGELYFKYRNYTWAGNVWPFLDRLALNPSVARLGVELVGFLLRLHRRPPAPTELEGVTFGAFLDNFGCSDQLRWRFLMPVFASICTCSYASLSMYPAATIVGYLTSGVVVASMHRVTLGVRNVVDTLSASAEAVRLASPVRSLRRQAEGVDVEDGGGHLDRFDHVVVATQANQALRVLSSQASSEERTALEAFRYETFDVVTHTDRRLAPPRGRWWSPVNFILQQGSVAPMATILMNPIHRGLEEAEPLLQTWNPLIEPQTERVHSRVRLERPVVDEAAQAGHRMLEDMHTQPDRRIWFCGSYASSGVPLQESAVVSAYRVADRVEAAASGVGV